MKLTKIEKEIVDKERLHKNIYSISYQQGKYGKLKQVTKSIKPFVCRICKLEFEKGAAHYNQSDYTKEGFFPVQTKVCTECGDKEIKNGAKVKLNKSKHKIK